jgi:hypothetical protein
MAPMPKRMADEPGTPQPLTLKRWSQRKREAARGENVQAAPGAPAAPATGASAGPAVAAPAQPVAPVEPAPLPPVESLDFDSDYAAFMQPKVSEETKRAALKKLFSDPSFNVMDGLDIYVGDYTQPDPMPAGMLDRLSAVYAMIDPAKPPADAAAVPDVPSPDAGARPQPHGEPGAESLPQPAAASRPPGAESPPAPEAVAAGGKAPE